MKINVLIDNHLNAGMESYTLPDFNQAEMVALLDDVQPMRLTVFAIGHDGLAQYPSRIATNAPNLAIDLPQVWKELARERGIKFAIYVSSLRNDVLVTKKREWERIRHNGLPAGTIDHTTNYLEEWLKPVLRELHARYQPDGYFFDGDYWTVGESIGPARNALRQRLRVGVDENDNLLSNATAERELTVKTYNEYLGNLGSFLHGLSGNMTCSVNLAFTFRHPVDPPLGINLITSDLPPFFSAIDSWIETSVVLQAEQRREVVVPLFSEPEGGGRKYAKPVGQLLHEIAPLIANDEAVHVYFPMSTRGKLDSSYAQTLKAVRTEIESRQSGSLKSDFSFDPDVLCLSDSEVLQVTQEFSELRGALLAANVAGMNVGVATTQRCIDRIAQTRLLIIPNGMFRSAKADSLVEEAINAGVQVLGFDDPDFSNRMRGANQHVDQGLVDSLLQVYEAGGKATFWSQFRFDRHWGVFARGLRATDGAWRLFLWNSIEKGTSLGRHVLYEGTAWAGEVSVAAAKNARIATIWGYPEQLTANEAEAHFSLTGPFVSIDGVINPGE